MFNLSYYTYYAPLNFFKYTKKNLTLYLFLFFYICILCLYLIYFCVPSDYEQNFNYQIIFLHVPLAWLTLGLYFILCYFAILFLLKKTPIFLLIIQNLTHLGIFLSLLTLFSGAFWGLPMWGSLYIGDIRLIGFLLLFFLYFINYLLFLNINHQYNIKIALYLLCFGALNLPLIKYSVLWWNTLHQPSSIVLQNTQIHIQILFPIILLFSLLFLYCKLYYIFTLRTILIQYKLKILNTIK